MVICWNWAPIQSANDDPLHLRAYFRPHVVGVLMSSGKRSRVGSWAQAARICSKVARATLIKRLTDSPPGSENRDTGPYEAAGVPVINPWGV